MTEKRVLIIGGTGVFGKRLVRHLAKTDGIAIYVSSRTKAKAEAFICSFDSHAALHAVALDCSENLRECLDEIKPFAVIDCSGPFQGANYDTATVVLEGGAHLIDLADARDYLADFAEVLDPLARIHGVVALTGASSTPTLSTCVARHLTAGWQCIDTIDIYITPGGKSEVGRSVIEAILSYAGSDVPVWANGKLDSTTGWGETRSVDIPELGRRRISAVETFDAEYLGPTFNVQSRVTFAAGLESQIEQRGIETLAMLRKRGLIKGLQGLIPALLAARKLTRIPTSDKGGMVVEVCGLNSAGVQCQVKWSLIAHDDHGPNIPILPAAAVLKKLLVKDVDAGARFGHTAVSLQDILGEMDDYNISTNTSEF